MCNLKSIESSCSKSVSVKNAYHWCEWKREDSGNWLEKSQTLEHRGLRCGIKFKTVASRLRGPAH